MPTVNSIIHREYQRVESCVSACFLNTCALSSTCPSSEAGHADIVTNSIIRKLLLPVPFFLQEQEDDKAVERELGAEGFLSALREALRTYTNITTIMDTDRMETVEGLDHDGYALNNSPDSISIYTDCDFKLEAGNHDGIDRGYLRACSEEAIGKMTALTLMHGSSDFVVLMPSLNRDDSSQNLLQFASFFRNMTYGGFNAMTFLHHDTAYIVMIAAKNQEGYEFVPCGRHVS